MMIPTSWRCGRARRLPWRRPRRTPCASDRRQRSAAAKSLVIGLLLLGHRLCAQQDNKGQEIRVSAIEAVALEGIFLGGRTAAEERGNHQLLLHRLHGRLRTRRLV